MIWTRNYVSETQGYESQNIFLLHNPWIEDQFSNMRGAWIIFCFTLHDLYSWKTTNSFPRASRSPEFNLPVSCRVYLHPHNLRHTLQKEPLTFVFWADVPQSNIEPIITKNPSFSGWKLSFEGKKMTEICSIIHKCTIHGEKNYMNLDFSSPLRNNSLQRQNDWLASYQYNITFPSSHVLAIWCRNQWEWESTKFVVLYSKKT